MGRGVVLAVVAALVCAAVAHGTGTRHLKKWQITHVTMRTSMNASYVNPTKAVCHGTDDGDIVGQSMANRLDFPVRNPKAAWPAIPWKGKGPYLPAFGPSIGTDKWTSSTTLTWGVRHEDPDTGACSITTATCTVSHAKHQVLHFSANPFPLSRGLMWFWWVGEDYPMWDALWCVPAALKGKELGRAYPRDGVAVHYRYVHPTCSDCAPDPMTRMTRAAWERKRFFHARLTGSGFKTKSGYLATTGSAHYSLDTAIKQVYG